MNLAYMIDRAARWYPDNIAVVDSKGRYTFKEVWGRANQFARALFKLGYKKGDRAAIVCANCVEYVEHDLALYKTGIVRVGLNPRLSAEEILTMTNDSGARSLFLSTDYLDLINKIKPGLTQVKHFIVADKPVDGMIYYHDLIKNELFSSPSIKLDENDLALLFYTGGTTGTPKGAMHTQKSVITVTLNLAGEAFHLNQNDAFLSAATLAHGNGYRTTAAWISGAKHVLVKGFEPEQIFETIEKEKITMLTTVPTTLARLCEFPGISKYNLNSLRMITYGAAPIAAEQLKTALRTFGKKLINIYGQAEAPIVITVFRPEEHFMEGPEEWVKRLGSVGRPYANVEVRIVDTSGNEVKPGEVGEITVRSPHCMIGYWNKPEATTETLRDGWIYTGDLATIDDREYITIVDRSKDIIITGGYNVYAREVEDVLYAHPAVREAAVIGVPDKEWGETVKAVVVLKPGAKTTEAEIIEHCRKLLTSYKKPKSVEFMDELPKSSIGKILKRDIKEKYWKGYQRRVN